MSLNLDKCKVMHAGLRNSDHKFQYKMRGETVLAVHEEPDLRVTVRRDTNFTKHFSIISGANI